VEIWASAASVASACIPISRVDHAASGRAPPVHAQGPRLAPSEIRVTSFSSIKEAWAKNQNLRFSQISAIRGGLFRLIFTCESSRPHALGFGAGALHRIGSVAEAVPSPKPRRPMKT